MGPLWQRIFRRLFAWPFSLDLCSQNPERSSPSRVRFAAPNNGAPLKLRAVLQNLPDKRESFLLNGYRWRDHHAAIMAPF